MIHGTVSADGVPTITLSIGSQDWTATIDTGFNGDLELPEALQNSFCIFPRATNGKTSRTRSPLTNANVSLTRIVACELTGITRTFSPTLNRLVLRCARSSDRRSRNASGQCLITPNFFTSFPAPFGWGEV